LPVELKRGQTDLEHQTISVSRQCELLGLAHSSWYYRPTKENPQNERLMRLVLNFMGFALAKQYACPKYLYIDK
jgi:hypothetical protein